MYREAFAGLPRQVWWLAAAMLVNRAGTMVLPFLTLYLTREHGYGLGTAGVLLALYGLGSIIGISIGGRLTDRIGAKPVQVTSLVLTSISFLILGEVDGRVAIGTTIVLLSIVAEAFRPASSAAVAAATDEGNRTRAFGLQRLALNLGFTVGPIAGGLLAEIDYSLLFWVDGLTCLLAAFVVAFAVRGAPPPTREERDESARAGRSPWKDRVALVAFGLVFLQTLMFFQLQSTFMVFLREERGFTEGLVGRLLAINTVIIVLLEMILLRRVERWNALRVAGVASLFIGLGYGLLPYGVTVAYVAGTIVLWTIGEMLSAPMMTAFVANRSDATNRGRYMGAFGLCFSVGSMIAPILGTQTYDSFGPGAVWGACLVLGAVTWAGFTWLAASERGGTGPTLR